MRYIVLFGSEARGESNLTSDVDIALVSDEPLTISERLEFSEMLGDETLPDYRVINTLTDDLDTNEFMNVNYHIKKDGLVIYER
ncbi:MAG: nucleotidyltransferase domain-containing protein [Defluviitaleaceae bacterium]|nr:nucleotidyltransferase domain-containing protein [Defluviitaleaceae bacterium]